MSFDERGRACGLLVAVDGNEGNRVIAALCCFLRALENVRQRGQVGPPHSKLNHFEALVELGPKLTVALGSLQPVQIECVDSRERRAEVLVVDEIKLPEKREGVEGVARPAAD